MYITSVEEAFPYNLMLYSCFRLYIYIYICPPKRGDSDLNKFYTSAFSS